MRILILPVIFLAMALSGYSQPGVKEMLKKIEMSVNSIHSGEYTYHDISTSINAGEDSSEKHYTYKCYFKRNLEDTLIGFKLASSDNAYQWIYNGNYLYENDIVNKTLTITDRHANPLQIKNMKKDKYIYPFFFGVSNLLNKIYYEIDSTIIKPAGMETVDNIKCYKLRLSDASINPLTNKSGTYIYISAQSFFPVRAEVVSEQVTGNVKMFHRFINKISGLKVNKQIDESRFSKDVLTTYNKEVRFTPSNDNDFSGLLSVGTPAPGWELPLLNGDKLSLSALKGKIVVMDFWYKACTPCQRQMIALQTLYDKFDKNKVVFVGVNTTDDPVKDKLQQFLSNRNITMPTVYNGQSIASLYVVAAAPALFIISKEGKIIFTLDGYSDTLLKDVSKVIEQNF